MLSYRHAFHAGNFADVIKHFLLVNCISYLQKKDAAVRFIDTHSGAGIYRLDDEMPSKLNESQNGILKLQNFMNTNFDTTLSKQAKLCLQNYLDLVFSFNDSNKNKAKKNNINLVEKYPGSPFLITKLLRQQDDAFFYELHPKDYDYLSKNLQKYFNKKHHNKNYHLFNTNGFQGWKANIISPSKRALVIIDPSYETTADYENVLSYLSQSLQRLKSATYCIWYPLLNKRESFQLSERLIHLLQNQKENKISWINTKYFIKNQQKYNNNNNNEANKFVGLLGTGMFIVNPPYFFPELVKEIFAFFDTIFLQENIKDSFEVIAEIF